MISSIRKDDVPYWDKHPMSSSRSDTTWSTIASIDVQNVMPQMFNESVNIWLNKPHVVNRRLCGSNLIETRCVNSDNALLIVEECLNKCEIPIDCHTMAMLRCLIFDYADDTTQQKLDTYLHIRTLLPKNIKKYSQITEVIVSKPSDSSWTFIPLTNHLNRCAERDIKTSCQYASVPFPYRVTLKPLQTETASFDLHIFETSDVLDSTKNWLINVLLQKLVHWSQSESLEQSKSSLKLVSIEKYNELYQNLKDKYGHTLVANWTENTDPLKFVYEDIGIAAYLMLIWEEERKDNRTDKLQSFVDLGCGNGLLVYILSSEGHQGMGLDIRRRKMWDSFALVPDMVLKERNVIPSNDCLFPEYDWLIGNHSDELTPWIPVMAARTSHYTRYFVLPCCHYDFVGKFQTKILKESQYRTYLNFVQEVGEVCGFHVEEDVLRIPSTKRVCFIGKTRTYIENEKSEIDSNIKMFIHSRAQGHINQLNIASVDPVGSWAENFIIRKEERVKNCTQVPHEVCNSIINTVFNAVLKADPDSVIETENSQKWRIGGNISISEVNLLIDNALLKQLKKESGGLQTLLRNHFQVFEVSGGQVKLRDWSLGDQRSRYKRKRTTKDYSKTKLCWFYEYHPDGCPLLTSHCAYAHGDDDLIKLLH